MADSKKLRFSTPSILNIFLKKIQGLIIGLVGQIDVKELNSQASNIKSAHLKTIQI